MLGFNECFQNGKSRITKVWLNCTLANGVSLEFHEDRVSMNGLVRDTSTTVDGQFTLGAAVTSKLTVILDNSDYALSGYDFRGATIIAWLGGEITNYGGIEGLHPYADVSNSKTLYLSQSDLTEAQQSLFRQGMQINIGTTDGGSDIAETYISDVSTASNNRLNIRLEDSITATTSNYVSIVGMQKINCGRYYVDEYKYDGNSINLVAYDDMSKFDIPCSTSGMAWRADRHPLNIIAAACTAAGVSNWRWYDTYPSPITSSADPPKSWDTMTLHDVISYWAQAIGMYLHIIYYHGTYYLRADWYDTSQLTSNQYDGGTFDTETTPYSDGATLDGGDFTYDDSEDDASDGEFGDRAGLHIIPSPYNLSVDTDDVQITGVIVELDPSDNINADNDTETYTTALYGSAGYVITITGNPFIDTTTKADATASYLASVINGMRFRPLSATVVENPAMEAGDVAIIQGRNANTYACFLSRVTYTVNAATEISCDAQSTFQNLKSRYSGAQKITAMVQRVASERAVANAETAMVGVLTSYASSRGLYQYEETDSSGGTIYTYGNASTLSESDIRWRVSAGSIMVSTDYGVTWNSALSADGTAVMQSLYAVGINADYIVAGDLTLGGLEKNVDGNFYLKDAQGHTRVTMNKYGIFHGKESISDIVNDGFYLSDDGFIIGEGDTERYIRMTPDGIIYIHDNPYYETSGEEYATSESSFFIEGVDSDGNTRQTILSSCEFTVGAYSRGSSYIVPFMVDENGNLSITGTFNNSDGQAIVSNGVGYPSGIILSMEVNNGPSLEIFCESSTYGVTIHTSDAKLKKDITNSTVNALDTINSIQHRSFRWKRNDEYVDNGYVAQEIENVIPGSVMDISQPDGSILKQINDPIVIPYLSKAIQELSAKVDALEARVAELEGR